MIKRNAVSVLKQLQKKNNDDGYGCAGCGTEMKDMYENFCYDCQMKSIK